MMGAYCGRPSTGLSSPSDMACDGEADGPGGTRNGADGSPVAIVVVVAVAKSMEVGWASANQPASAG